MEGRKDSKNVSSSEFRQKLAKVASAFLFDEKLQRILTGPLLMPHDLNTLNTKFIGPLKLTEGDSAVLNDLVSKYVPKKVSRETVLTMEGVSNLRKLSLVVNLAADLKNSSLNLGELLQGVDDRLSQSGLDPLVSSEEVYRVRNHKIDPSVANFPRGIVEKNPQLDLPPAYDKFIGSIKSGKSLDETSKLLNESYGGEHTKVTFEPAEVSGLRPVYGMNGV